MDLITQFFTLIILFYIFSTCSFY